ncbi:MAG TPA: TIGR03118 family protein [Pyrinomonadaceae bacterium]|jgi:uncharacterized protein (TIGR03118 family)
MSHLLSTYQSRRKLLGLCLICLLGLLVLAGSPAQVATHTESGQDATAIPVIVPGSAYRQTNLVSDLPGLALIEDPMLVNPWGVTLTATSPFWLVNNGTSTSSLYRGDVGSIVFFKQPGMPFITIPGGRPTGGVANGTSDFVVANGSASGAARFIFDSLNGQITGWNPNVPAAGSTVAQVAATQANTKYTGLAIGNNGTANFLYAADFANGKIDVYNSTFTLQPAASFPFSDSSIPATPGNTYHPFNIQSLGGKLYVAYAKVGADGRDEEGVGNGFIRRFDFNGVRDSTFGINNGPLNSPWGMVIAPASFGLFGNQLLVGNFGEGNPSIHAFNVTTGALLGPLQNEAGEPIEIDELWALTFGNGGNGGDPNTLYFSAGPAEEKHGLFGSLKPTIATATNLIQFSSADASISEGSGSIQITVTRAGNVSGTSTVNYATFDEPATGHASQKNDYEIAVGKLTFNPGETSKTFRIPLVDDRFVEGDETVNIALSNPTGAGTGLGSPNMAELTITDNDTAPTTANPIDDTQFFVRQQYLDFLNREPDTAGFNAWVNLLNGCANGNTACDRVTVSQSFFGSPEYQSKGYFAIRNYRAAFGRDPLYGEFSGDLSTLNGASAGDSNTAKANFTTNFLQRNEARATLDALTNAQFVDRLISNTGVPIQNRDQLVNDLNTNVKTRAQVLTDIVENPRFVNDVATFNRAFVLAEYFGYLRRNPEQAGFNAWLNYLNTHPGDFRTMVNGFVNSAEYRQRFGAS